MIHVLFAVHTLSTLMMAGVIWFVQLVHYPLFACVAASDFHRYEKEHMRRTTWIVAPLMIAEGATAAALLMLGWDGPHRLLLLAGFSLLAVIWASTALLQVPCHARLASGFDSALARRLVVTNWIRTAAWTIRGMIALALLMEVQP